MRCKFLAKLKLWFLTFIAIAVCCCHACDNTKSSSDPNPISIEPEDTVSTLFDASYTFVESGSQVQDRNFYLLTLVNELYEVVTALESDSTFNIAYEEFLTEIKNLSSNANVEDVASVFMLTDDEIIDQSELVTNIISDAGLLDVLMMQNVFPSGCYIKYEEQEIARALYLSWKEVLGGLNTVFDQYLLGAAPVDKDSDGPAFEVASVEYRGFVNELIQELLNEEDSIATTYGLSLCFALKLLKLNNREEAGSFEPLYVGENALTLSTFSSIVWDDYFYSNILLLGDAPNSAGDAENISDGAIERIAFAVNHYNAGYAPLIIISGANLAPNFTTYYEAIEMKKYMLAHYDDIPEEVILLEPHARHTYSNLRNASRLIFKYEIPSTMKGLVVSSSGHIDLIESNAFQTDCYSALGYMPATIGSRISDQSVEYTAIATALHIDTRDPLDP